MNALFYWAPRLLGIAAILFISLFALDVFEPDKPWPDIATAMVMHLLPSAILAMILVVAWRVEWLGGILFAAVGLSPFLLLRNPAWVNLMIGGPFILTGLLFLVHDRMQRNRRNEAEKP